MNLIILEYRRKTQENDEEYVKVDHFLFPPAEELYVFAGDDVESCPNVDFTLNGFALYSKEILWSSDGDGWFDDSTLAQPTYTFGTNDKQTRNVTLTLTASDNVNQLTDMVTITLPESLEFTVLGMPEGDTLVDTRLTTESIYQSPFEGEVSYLWSIEPEEAGSLNAEENQVSIDWNEDYRGMATLNYSVSNECGEFEIAPALSIHVINSTGLSETDANDIEVYPNPANELVRVKATGIANGETVIRIIDVLGRTVLKTKSNCNDGVLEAQINIATLRGGIYELQVVTEGKVFGKRLVIE